MHLGTLIKPSKIVLGNSLESDLHAPQLAHPYCINTGLLFHHLRGLPLKPGPTWLTRKWLGRTMQDRGPGTRSRRGRACVRRSTQTQYHVSLFGLRGLSLRFCWLRDMGCSGQITSRSWRASRGRTGGPVGGTAHGCAQRSSTTVTPAPGTVRRRLRPPRASPVRTTRRFPTGCLER